MGILNHHAIYNEDIKIPTPDVPFESSYESVLDPYTIPINSIDDDEKDHILKFLHSEHDENLLGVDLQMIQAWLLFDPP